MQSIPNESMSFADALRVIEQPWAYLLYCLSGLVFMWAAVAWWLSFRRLEKRRLAGETDEAFERAWFRNTLQCVFLVACSILLAVAGPTVFTLAVPSIPSPFGRGPRPTWIPFFPWSLPVIWLLPTLLIAVSLEWSRRRRSRSD